MISADLVQYLHTEFRLDWHGIHGAGHWARVRSNGLLLAVNNGANTDVVELFAFLHDARRESDGYDPDHGRRAAELARELDGRFFSLAREERRLLEFACREHSNGDTRAGVTVQTCWDADRLDLGRIGITPHPDYLGTAAARDAAMIAGAVRRSTRRVER